MVDALDAVEIAAVIGSTMVSPRGCCSAWNRAPMAPNTVSGTARPDEELTATMALSGICLAAPAAVTIFGIAFPLRESRSARLADNSALDPSYRHWKSARPSAIRVMPAPRKGENGLTSAPNSPK